MSMKFFRVLNNARIMVGRFVIDESGIGYLLLEGQRELFLVCPKVQGELWHEHPRVGELPCPGTGRGH